MWLQDLQLRVPEILRVEDVLQAIYSLPSAFSTYQIHGVIGIDFDQHGQPISTEVYTPRDVLHTGQCENYTTNRALKKAKGLELEGERNLELLLPLPPLWRQW
jgi:hypothetical protein